jgi:hypothetical protein
MLSNKMLTTLFVAIAAFAIACGEEPTNGLIHNDAGATIADARLTLDGSVLISLDALRAGHEGWLPDYMAGRD